MDDEPAPVGNPADIPAASARPSTILASAVLPWVPFAVAYPAALLTQPPLSLVLFQPLSAISFLAIPVLGGLAVRYVGSWPAWRTVVGVLAAGTGLLAAWAWTGMVNETCLSVAEVALAIIPAAFGAGWGVGVAALTAGIARPTGSRRRFLAGMLAGGAATAPGLAGVVVLGWLTANLVARSFALPNCELIHIL